MLAGNREMRAGGETNQIAGVGQPTDLVKIVNAPDETAFDVAPGSEVFDVQIADAEHLGRGGGLGGDVRPGLRPTVKSRAQEGEYGFPHEGVLAIEIGGDERDALAQPGFVFFGRAKDVHVVSKKLLGFGAKGKCTRQGMALPHTFWLIRLKMPGQATEACLYRWRSRRT